VISTPGHSTALAFSRCVRRETEKRGLSKKLSSGQKWTLVPVLRLPQVPTTCRSCTFSPFSKAML
jgi:hypothetical protein